MATDTTLPAQERASLSKTLINTAAAGTVVIAAAVVGKRVRVYRLHLNTHASQLLTLQDTDAVVLLPQQSYGAQGGVLWDHSGEPWLETATGKGLSLVLVNAVQTSGIIWYTQRDE